MFRQTYVPVLSHPLRVCLYHRKSEGCVRSAYDLLMHHLAEEHAEVRLSAHCLVDELFKRSHTFRECLLDTFQEYLALAVGVDADRPLPPPVGAAKVLKARTLLSIKNWTETYGGGYPKLKLSYNYLKYNLRVSTCGRVPPPTPHAAGNGAWVLYT